MRNKKSIWLTLALLLSLVSCSFTPADSTLSGGQDMPDTYASLYADGSLRGLKGLDEPDQVGIVQERFEKERLYGSEKLQPTYVLQAADFGMSGTDKKDDTAAFIACLAEAKKRNGALGQIVLPGGELDFIEQVNEVDPAYGIVFDDLHNLIISGKGSTLYFHGETKGIHLANCSNLYFEDFQIDWGVPPFSMGTILSNDGTTFKVQVHSGYKVDGNTRVSAFLEYNKTSYTPRTKGNDIYGDVKYTKYLGDNQLEITFNSAHKVAPEGTLVVLRHYLYEYDCFFAEGCQDLHFESVKTYSAPGMMLRAYSSKNIYANRFSCLLKSHTDRLMSVTADAIHTIDCYGDLKVTNSTFENCGDDALNSHGMYSLLLSRQDDQTITINNPRGYNFIPSIGDTMEFRTTDDLTLLQQDVVTAVSKSESGFVLSLKDPLLADVVVGVAVGNVTRNCTLLFENNLIRNKRCRGVLVQTRHATIRNNTFANLSDAGVLLTCDANDWYEALVPGDVLIENNKFLKDNFASGNTGGDICITGYGKGYNLAATGSIQGVDIHNNFFGNCANSGIYANSVFSLKIRNNALYNVALAPKTKAFNAGIYFAYSSEVSLTENAVYLNTSADFKTLAVGPGVNVDNVTVKDNIGFDQSDLVSGNTRVTFAIPEKDAGLTLSLDGVSFDGWSSLKDSLSIQGISDVDQNELAFDDSTFKINGLKMTYDATGLYLGYDVFDDEVAYSQTSSFWEGDGVEICLADDLESKDTLSVLKLTNSSCLELFMSGNANYGNQVVPLRTSDAVLAHQSEIKMSLVSKSDGKGYVGKAFIPFTAIPTIQEKFLNGAGFAFSINFIDSDTSKTRVQYCTSAHPVEYSKNVPYKMAQIVKEAQ